MIEAKSIVPKVGEPDIDESYIRQQDAVLLETLLIDRTMTAVNDGEPVLFMPPFEFKPMEGGK